jgi:hypothetical protein
MSILDESQYMQAWRSFHSIKLEHLYNDNKIDRTIVYMIIISTSFY